MLQRKEKLLQQKRLDLLNLLRAKFSDQHEWKRRFDQHGMFRRRHKGGESGSWDAV
jgi:hypothetical protein